MVFSTSVYGDVVIKRICTKSEYIQIVKKEKTELQLDCMASDHVLSPSERKALESQEKNKKSSNTRIIIGVVAAFIIFYFLNAIFVKSPENKFFKGK
jgi:hypothetical protein